jgi:Flp pilus assembly protein TadB
MKSNEVVYWKWASWTASVALAAVGTAGLGLWMVQGASLPLRTVGGLATLTAALCLVWLYRIRAARRLSATLDAYAERELARTQRRLAGSHRKSKHAFSQGPV